MIVSWGRPTEMSPGSTVDQVLWDTCVKYCYNSMYCVLAYGNDSSCTLFDFGDVSTVEKLDPEENLKVAMKVCAIFLGIKFGFFLIQKSKKKINP